MGREKKKKKKKKERKKERKEKERLYPTPGKALNNLVLFDRATYDKLCKEVPNYKLLTPAVVSERLKIRGLIKLVSKHRAQVIYTRNTKGGDAPAAGEDA
ncbi:unnamed protein product [Nyctereutes procyonoides]|uniref:40S ribosomal protein S25 n=1 Tax=Nyctereutes procyonoides TaxID=34880 RepID=A0A811ZFB8_NYCPR|nr:unnamed protein product [Nyctereutes procyonoides]